jgi:alpha-tubulin suppressor-like RCC1 family protein
VNCNTGYSPCSNTCVDETKNGNCGGCGVTCNLTCISSGCVKATAIGAGFEHVCALLSNGTVACWGTNTSGQLGNGTSTCTNNSCLTPHVVPGLTGVTAIGVGEAQVCAVVAGGAVKCWGDNTYGEIGSGGTGSCSGIKCSMTPVTVPGVSNAIAVASGRAVTCALISGGTVMCWGDNSFGELGNGSQTNSSTPVTVSGLTTAKAIGAGAFHACALRTDNTVVCWGDDSADELGSAPVSCDTSGDTCQKTPVASGANIAQTVTAFGPHTCAVEGQQVQCWGTNSNGLGDGTTTASYALVKASGINLATSVTAGDYGFCAILSGGSVQCWGGGPLGNGTDADSPTPVVVQGISNATAVAVGAEGGCVVLTTGGISCWSENGAGEMGNGTTTPSLTATPVTF